MHTSLDGCRSTAANYFRSVHCILTHNPLYYPPPPTPYPLPPRAAGLRHPLLSYRRAGRPCVLPLQGHGGWRQDRPAAAVRRWAVDSHTLRAVVEGGNFFFFFLPSLQEEPLLHTGALPSKEER